MLKFRRGIGPQVYGIAFCPVRYEEELKSLGFAGSLLPWPFIFDLSRDRKASNESKD
jgi:hypothetical protein